MTRKYSSISVSQLLDSPMGTSDTTLTLADSAAVTALLGGVTLAGGNVDQFTIAVDPDTASEEIIFVRGSSGNTLTGLVRAQAGTSAIAHSAGAAVKHVLTSNDLDYYTSGVGSAVTASGTATLTNKTIDPSTNTLPGVVTETGTQTLTNKTISISDNTLTGVVSLTGTQTLTNKTLTTPVSSIAFNAQTTAYTLVASDKSKLVTVNSSTTANVTVPAATFSAGDIVYISRFGTGTVGIVGAAGTTINATPGTTCRAQYSTVALICTASNTFLLVGDLA